MPAHTDVATVIARAFEAYHLEFKGMTRRARGRFARREWAAARQDTLARLDLWRLRVDRTVAEVEATLARASMAAADWPRARDAYARLAAARSDGEIAETWYNSVVRRVLATVGHNRATEFTDPGPEPAPPADDPSATRAYPASRLDPALLRAILLDADLGAPFADLDRDVHLAAAAATTQLAAAGVGELAAVEMVPAVFYRNKGAYLVGRARAGDRLVPLVLPLVHAPDGVAVDAVLVSSDEVSVVFGFTRSYFHVEIERPRAVIAFLRSIVPLKRLDELYTAIGYHKHGKTELYRDVIRALGRGARFEQSEGDRGLVMEVFVLPALNVAFKVIRDRFDPPKHTTRDRVIDKYHLVFVHDRVGRLADAQEFRDLEFRREHFAPGLLAELRRTAGRTVRADGDRVVVRHAYTERRVTPLNLYLRAAHAEAAREAVLDYGHAVKELAAANIFPGDMLLKNFGVTRHGRVVFYDYDELCLLTDCTFRRIPSPPHEEDELAAEPWFHVGERDVFPEEFRHFTLLPGDLGAAFEAAHGDLFDVAFWHEMQRRQRDGEMPDFFPYRVTRRLREP